MQRTVGLIPVPQETGNERVSWVFKDVPGLTVFNTPPVYDTIALLHFNGINGSTTITDVYGNTSWALTGPGSLTTGAPKFGSASFTNAGFFVGPGPTSSSAFATFGVANFTIEIWFKSSFATTMTMVNFGLNDLGVSLTGGNVSVSSFNAGGTLVCATSGTNYADNAWHFCQVVRSGLVTVVYIDGVQKATGPDTRDYSAGRSCCVGGLVGSASLPFLGQLDDFRLTLSARPNAVPTVEFAN